MRCLSADSLGLVQEASRYALTVHLSLQSEYQYVEYKLNDALMSMLCCTNKLSGSRFIEQNKTKVGYVKYSIVQSPYFDFMSVSGWFV